jgi:hypothetical protein
MNDPFEEFDWRVKELSEEAQVMARAITSAPDELWQVWRTSSDRIGMVRSYLNGVGWTAKQITESLSEIRELVFDK